MIDNDFAVWRSFANGTGRRSTSSIATGASASATSARAPISTDCCPTTDRGTGSWPSFPEQLRATLPIGRVVGPGDVAALAVHLMTNTALTGATYDVDGGQQLVPA